MQAWPGLSPRFRRRRHASSAWAAAQQRRGAGDVGVRAAARRAHVCARGCLGAVRRGARSPLLLARARRRSRACASWPSCVRRHRRLAAAVRVGLELASCAAALACAAAFGPSATARAWPPEWIKGHATASSWLASCSLHAQPVEESGRGGAVPIELALTPVPPPLGLPPDTLGAHTAAAVTQWRPFGAGGELRCSTRLVV